MAPETIAGRYEVIEEVGRGGMGAVWLCRDRVLGRQVAVKQLGGLPGETAPHLARALREARASAALNHPHVVSIYDAVEDGDHVWLVMEYVPSRTLSALTAQEGPFPPERAAFIGAQIADGLAAAHAHGTVHRDVKPGNILVGAGDLAKVSDFGIARHVDDETLTQTGMVTGTPMFFSPQLARGRKATAADDVWALGATLFTMVEGTAPWPQESNAIAMLVHIAEHAPPRPVAAGPLTPLITQMLSVDPEARPDMATVASELHALAEGEPAGSEQPTLAFVGSPPTVEREVAPATPAYSPPEARPGRRRWWPVAAALVALALVAVFGAALLLAGNDDNPGITAHHGSEASRSAPETDAASSPTEDAPTTEDTPASTTPATDTATDTATTDAAQFVTDYYALLPADTKSAWDLLSDDMQAKVGSYGAYKGFWKTIDSVSVDDASDSGSGAVTVDLTYTSSNGTESETRLITVDDTGDGLQIVDDRVI